MTRELTISIVLLVAVVSGTSKSLFILASLLISLLTLISIRSINAVFKIRRVSAGGASIFFFMLGVSIVTMPFENLRPMAMTLSSSFLSLLIIRNISSQTASSQASIYYLVLGLILIGDLVQLSGVLGSDMDVYKSLVQFDLLSDLDRESDFGFLSLRYHGWFAEPSYHGAFTGLFCALIWNRGVRWKALLMFMALFFLCPTPMMALAFGAGLLYGLPNWLDLVAKRPVLSVSIFFIFAILMSLFFGTRFASLSSGVVEIVGGDTVNSSEFIRLIDPLIALFSHFASYGLLPESTNCIDQSICMAQSQKFPLIAFVVFFGWSGLVVILLFVKWLYQSSFYYSTLTLLIASLLSGGAGYLLHFGLFVALLLKISTYSGITLMADEFQQNNANQRK